MSNGFPEWINLYGEGLAVNGNLLPVDTVIRAFNHNGGLAGEGILHFNPRTGGNRLKFMPVYKAPGPDENMPGVPEGEEFILRINGHEVIPIVDHVRGRLVYSGEMGRRIQLDMLETDYIPGDVNGDGVVNEQDVERLAGALWMGSGWQGINMDACDVDGTGGVNVADLTRLIAFVYRDGVPPVWYPINK